MKLNTKTLADVEIGIPVIAEAIYHARFAKVEVKPNKTGDGNNLVIQYKILDNPVFLFKDNKEIQNRGQVVATRHYSLKPTDNYDPDQAMKELAVAIKHPVEKDLELDDLKNFTGMVMVKIDHKAEEEDPRTKKKYPEGNDIGRVTPVPEGDAFTPPPF